MAPPPPPPPPPPPLCLPFGLGGKKPKRRLTYSEKSMTEDYTSQRSSIHRLERQGSYSPTATLTSRAEKLTFSDDTESYDVPSYHGEAREVRPTLRRANTTKATAVARDDSVIPTPKRRWGYGWGLGKKDKEKEVLAAREELEGESLLEPRPPNYESPRVSNQSRRSNSVSTRASNQSKGESIRYILPSQRQMASPTGSNGTHWNPIPPPKSGEASRSNTQRSANSKSSGRSQRRPALYPNESSSTLVGSALERKMTDRDSIPEREDSIHRLNSLRELMEKDQLHYYIIPTEDAHGSEYVAINDKRREWISGFTGSAGQAIISKTNAYLVVDSRYWLQAAQESDDNWIVIRAGENGGPRDWIEWLAEGRLANSRIGIDARMITYENATRLNSLLQPKGGKLVYPPQNLVDLIWREKPPRSKAKIFVQPLQFAGRGAGSKLGELRKWIREQAPSVPAYSKTEAKPNQVQVGTLLTNLSDIAYLLNLRGEDIPFNPVFLAYLFVGLDRAVLFVDPDKVTDAVGSYLSSVDVECRDYNDVWSFLRKHEWGEGKIIISPKTSYAISLMLTSFRYTVLKPYVENMKAIKNDTELDGLRRAYLRDAVAFVRFLAWLEQKIVTESYSITEYEAAWRLTEYRRQSKNYAGLAYENISATGANAALPHYSPRKKTASMIDRETPYLNDSGGQYLDGTCDTTRTVHFGRPTDEQCTAFTKVLQGHIAIDSAIFPAGTTGKTLDILARKALWQDGLNYGHGTGHGVGAYLNVHEGPHGFGIDEPLLPGMVITNEPGFYKSGEWGIRIESALTVVRVKPRSHMATEGEWYGFERLTCVPIQTKMVNETMLTADEKKWIKIHNRRCFELLQPYLRDLDDKRALKWLQRQSERQLGLARPGPGGIAIDWD